MRITYHRVQANIRGGGSVCIDDGCLPRGGVTPPKWENMSKLSKCLQNQDASENPEKYQMKAHFLLSSVVYNIVPFYV